MRKGIDKVLGGILVFLMALMTVDVLYGVFMRYVLNSQPGWTEEIARFSLMWIGILGAAYAAGQNNHLSIDLISTKLNEQGNRRLSVFINILIIAFAGGVLLIGGIRLMYVTSHLGQTSAGLKLPMSLVYSVLPISGFLIVLYKLMDLFTTPVEA
jgi:TRAP-type C4-dicarboxylate transport system permease small subunit